MASLGIAIDRFADQWRAIRAQREATADQWRDEVQRHFEREYWDPYERTVPSAINQLVHLRRVIAQAQSEVP